MPNPLPGPTHYVYLLECADKSLYVGSTQNLQARLLAHAVGKASYYTKLRRPVKLLHQEGPFTYPAARIREAQLKGWSRAKKLALARQPLRKATGFKANI